MNTSPQTETSHTQTSQAVAQPADMLRANTARLAGPWWLFLLTGIGWLLISKHQREDSGAAHST